MSKGSRLAPLWLFPVPGLEDPSLQRQQQAGGMEPAFQNPDSERVKCPWKKSWVAVVLRICHYPLTFGNPCTATFKYTPALEGTMVMVPKAHPGPGFLQVYTVGVKAALPPSPPTNTPIYTNKQATALAQRSFSCHHCCTSCSVIQGAVGARVTGGESPVPADSG